MSNTFPPPPAATKMWTKMCKYPWVSSCPVLSRLLYKTCTYMHGRDFRQYICRLLSDNNYHKNNWFSVKALWYYLPSVPFSLSFVGSKFRLPAMDRAVTNSGDVTNAWVAGLASLRPVKFRLYDVTIVFFSPFFTSLRSHWPMQGPQAFARTVPPKSLNICA